MMTSSKRNCGKREDGETSRTHTQKLSTSTKHVEQQDAAPSFDFSPPIIFDVRGRQICVWLALALAVEDLQLLL